MVGKWASGQVQVRGLTGNKGREGRAGAAGPMCAGRCRSVADAGAGAGAGAGSHEALTGEAGLAHCGLDENKACACSWCCFC